jgi:hypothetical protein
MKSRKVALIDQTSGSVVPLAELQQYATALQQQVDDDLVSAWGVRADISALATGTPIPPGTWPIKIVDSIPGDGGVHLDENGQPYAEAVNGPQLSIAISHELLEMLVDPWGDRFTPAVAIDPAAQGRQVFYLVEVADPCEISNYAINGVQVSDFILPSFYDPSAKLPVDFLHTLTGPLPKPVPPGCYISWIDPQDGAWHQQQADGSFVTVAATPGVNPRADRDRALGDQDDQRHDIPAIYRSWG